MMRIYRCYDHGFVTERAWGRRHQHCYSPAQARRVWGDGVIRAVEGPPIWISEVLYDRLVALKDAPTTHRRYVGPPIFSPASVSTDDDG